LIIGKLKVVPYSMWYNLVPPFIPIDPNMYLMYYSGIKGPDPLNYGKKERYPSNTIKVEPMPFLDQLE
jgi:hypothetical protein